MAVFLFLTFVVLLLPSSSAFVASPSFVGPVSARFATIANTSDRKSTADQPLCPGEERKVERAEDLDGEIFQRLVSRRARSILGKAIKPIRTREERLAAENDISEYFEKINLGNDFLPASFLRDGANRANAVCRIVTPTNLGSGSLISDGSYILTNNHVIDSEELARRCTAEFGYEQGENAVRVALQPGRLFITDDELDFTIVACDTSELNGIDPIPLLRNPATVTRHERVNIIQHPQGRKKEIAIHDNLVQRVKDLVIRYDTDTQPGSSGAPVFNNEWNMVALHHAGWSTSSSGRATNEGIRISSIVDHLMWLQDRETTSQDELEKLLRTIPDSSPYLGFFDHYGVGGGEDGFEVEVPDFTGSGDFADIGFWNIEHFNKNVKHERVQDVADVVSRLSMDVLGLTEVQEEAVDRLKRELTLRGDSFGHVLLDVAYAQDLAVLFDKDTTTVELAGDIAQRHADKLNAKTAGKKVFPRQPLFARCSVEEGNSTPVQFMLIVVHLKAFGDALSQARRRLAAETLVEIIDDIRDQETLPVVLGGDFNERLNTDVLRAIKESPDLFSLTADDATTDAISYIGRSHRSLIDHIMVSKDVRLGEIQGDDAAIVRLDKSVSDFASDVSDHVPVVFRMIYGDPHRPPDPPLPVTHTFEIPPGSENVDLSFH